MASLTDDNEAGGNLDKRNIWLIGAGHTRHSGFVVAGTITEFSRFSPMMSSVPDMGSQLCLAFPIPGFLSIGN